MRSCNRLSRRLLAVGFGCLCLTAGLALAQNSALTLDKVLDYLDLEVKEETIIKRVNESATKFTLGAGQVKLLKSRGASERLIDALQKKGDASRGALPADASDIGDFVLILDCSGSMKDQTSDNRTKWEVARDAAIELIGAIPEGRQLAFVVYGHDKALQCKAVEVIRPLSPLDSEGREALVNRLNAIEPIGNTPIALALESAGEELKASQALSKVVLITDGVETCQGIPATVARKLAANKNLKGGVNVIGFDLKENESAATRKIAQEGKGKYYDAKKAADLAAIIKGMKKDIAAAVEPEVVARGPVPSTRTITIAKPKLKFPEMARIRVVAAGHGRGNLYVNIAFDTLAEGTQYDQPLRIGRGVKNEKFDVYFIPKERPGERVLVAQDVCPDQEQPNVLLRLEEHVGFIRVNLKDAPKPRHIYVNHPGDRGNVGLNAIQSGEQFGKDIMVPAGTYDVNVYLTGSNNPELVAEKLEVKAGKVSLVE